MRREHIQLLYTVEVNASRRVGLYVGILIHIFFTKAPWYLKISTNSSAFSLLPVLL